MSKLKRILLVEDSVVTAQATKKLLSSMEAAEIVDICTGGEEAIAYLKGGDNGEFPHPDLILLDINMPGMDGFEFMEEYIKLDKKVTKSFELHICLLSGHILEGENYEKSKGYKPFGLFEQVVKPMDEEDVEELLERLEEELE